MTETILRPSSGKTDKESSGSFIFLFKTGLATVFVICGLVGYANGHGDGNATFSLNAVGIHDADLAVTSTNFNTDINSDLDLAVTSTSTMTNTYMDLATTVGDTPDFCWKDSYGRGVGKIPKKCAPNQDRIGLLCYAKCQPGYARFGLDCHQKCPAGWSKQGLFCRKSEYGRGGGYFASSNRRARRKGYRSVRDMCAKKHPSAPGCDRYGTRIYPNCRAGKYMCPFI